MYDTAIPDCTLRSANPTAGADHDAERSTQFIVELLEACLETIGTNRAAAAQYISRACAVLQEATEPPLPTDGRLLTQGGLAPWQIKSVKAFIDANLDKPLDVPALASAARLGPSYFQRAFRKTVGTGPHAYLVGRRIKRAKELMLQSDAPLAEIALAAGFADQAHFTMRFRSAVGTTPGAWRRERRDAARARGPVAAGAYARANRRSVGTSLQSARA